MDKQRLLSLLVSLGIMLLCGVGCGSPTPAPSQEAAISPTIAPTNTVIPPTFTLLPPTSTYTPLPPTLTFPPLPPTATSTITDTPAPSPIPPTPTRDPSMGGIEGLAFRIDAGNPIMNMSVVLGGADNLYLDQPSFLFWQLFDAFASSETSYFLDNSAGAYAFYNINPGKYTLGLMSEYKYQEEGFPFCNDGIAPSGWAYAWKAAINSAGQPDLSGLVPAIAYNVDNVLIIEVQAGQVNSVDINLPCR
jgi:hypothetical protein